MDRVVPLRPGGRGSGTAPRTRHMERDLRDACPGRIRPGSPAGDRPARHRGVRQDGQDRQRPEGNRADLRRAAGPDGRHRVRRGRPRRRPCHLHRHHRAATGVRRAQSDRDAQPLALSTRGQPGADRGCPRRPARGGSRLRARRPARRLATAVPVAIEPVAVAAALGASLVMAVLAALAPARAMAGLAPAEVFR